MKQKEIRDNAKRWEIFSYILKYPGLHFRELSRKLHISRGTLEYHLNYMRKEGFLIIKKEGRFARYYALNDVGENYKKILNLLRQKVPRAILRYIIGVPMCTQDQIADFVKRSNNTVSYHLKKFEELGLIEVTLRGNKKEYEVVDYGFMFGLFITYYKRLFDERFDADANWYAKHLFDDKMDRILDTFFDIFPHPYYV